MSGLQTQRWVIQKLQSAIDNKRLCILTGSGISYAVAQLPMWDSLLENALQFADESHVEPAVSAGARAMVAAKMPLIAGQVIRDLLSRDHGHLFDTWLEVVFQNPEVDEDSQLLRVLRAIHQSDPSIRFATTNYDTVLDRHLGLLPLDWSEERGVYAFFKPGILPPSRLLHIHGTYSYSRNVVFSSSDYAVLTADRQGHPPTDPLRRLLENYTVLFIGCGGTVVDPHFREAFQGLGRHAAADHIMLYRRSADDSSPAPNYSQIFAYTHDDYDNLPQKLKTIFPRLGALQAVQLAVSEHEGLAPGSAGQPFLPPASPVPQHALGIRLSPDEFPYVKLGWNSCYILLSCFVMESPAEIQELRISAVQLVADVPHSVDLIDYIPDANESQARFDGYMVFQRQLIALMGREISPQAAGWAKVGAAGYTLLNRRSVVQQNVPDAPQTLNKLAKRQIGDLWELPGVDEDVLWEILNSNSITTLAQLAQQLGILQNGI